MRIAEGDHKFLLIVDSYTRRSLHTLTGQIGVRCSLRVAFNISGGVLRLPVVLLLQSTGIVFTRLLGVCTEMKTRKRIHLATT